MGTVLRLELRLLLRDRAARVGLVLLLVAGGLALLHGRAVIERQREALAGAPAREAEHRRAILGHQPADGNAGDQLYYLTFHTAHVPGVWAPFSLGQRDVHAFNLKIRMLALHGQLYDADLANPLLAAFGNVDAAFVLTLLVPLLVIALAYDLWAEDRELGTWDLMRAQPTGVRRVLAARAAVRGAAVLVPSLVLLVLAVGVLGLPLDARLALVALATTLYVAVWLGAVALVASFGRSSEFNLVALLGTWLGAAILLPALVNVAAATAYPAPEALELTVRQRQGYHGAWDRPLETTMADFFRRYPEWASSPVPTTTYSNAWYYAMQQRGDDEAEPAARAYFAALEARQRASSLALAWCPPAAFQLALNGVARTDLDSHLAYLRSVAEYHESLKRHFFPVIFANRTIGEVDWEAAPRHRFVDEGWPPHLWLHLGALAVLAVGVLGVGSWRLGRRVG